MASPIPKAGWLRIYSAPLLEALFSLSCFVTAAGMARYRWFEPFIQAVSPWVLSRRTYRYVYQPEHYPWFVAWVVCIGLILSAVTVWSTIDAPRVQRRLDAKLQADLEDLSSRNTRSLDGS